MARWRLTGKHYLNCPGIIWEQIEVNRDSGAQARKQYAVPRFLDPDNPKDQNYPHDGMVVVCYEGKGQPRDIIFIGKPTPEMEPLDDEAEAISQAESKNWVHPIESLEGTYGDTLIKQFEAAMSNILRQQGGAVSPQQSPDVSALLAKIDQLTAQVQDLSARVEVQEQVEDEPLPDVEPTAEELAAAEAAAKAAAPIVRRA